MTDLGNTPQQLDRPELIGQRLAYGLALYPPQEVQQQLRADLNERGVSYPHRFHLTLKYAFVPTHRADCSLPAVSKIISRYDPFRLRSSGRLLSEDTLCHLLLIEQNPSLMRLHWELVALLASSGSLLSPDTARFEGAGYNPHITIAYGATREEYCEYTLRLAGYEPVIAFEARSVELSCFAPGRPDPIGAAARVFALGDQAGPKSSQNRSA